jgi:hypothetical protein
MEWRLWMKTFDSDFMNYQLPADTKDKRIRLYELSATSRRKRQMMLRRLLRRLRIITALLFRSHAEHWIIIYSSIISASPFRRHVIHWIIAAVQNYCCIESLPTLLFKRYVEYFLLFIFVIFLFLSPIKGL